MTKIRLAGFLVPGGTRQHSRRDAGDAGPQAGGMRVIPWIRATLLCVLLACSASVAAASAAPASEPTAAEKIYYFQHRLLRDWTHGTQGAFFDDLRKGATDRLVSAATQYLGKESAQKLVVRALPDAPAVLLTFPSPAKPPECFFVLILKVEDGYRYLTLEMAEDLLGNSTKSVAGEWTKAGSHLNFGPRTYADEKSFLAEYAPPAATQ